MPKMPYLRAAQALVTNVETWALTLLTAVALKAQIIARIKGPPLTNKKNKKLRHLQMYYVIKGWIKFSYDGIGEVLALAGTCVNQPPGITSKSLIRMILR